MYCLHKVKFTTVIPESIDNAQVVTGGDGVVSASLSTSPLRNMDRLVVARSTHNECAEAAVVAVLASWLRSHMVSISVLISCMTTIRRRVSQRQIQDNSTVHSLKEGERIGDSNYTQAERLGNTMNCRSLSRTTGRTNSLAPNRGLPSMGIAIENLMASQF